MKLLQCVVDVWLSAIPFPLTQLGANPEEERIVSHNPLPHGIS